MGLSSTQNGVKAQLLKRFPGAFREATTLLEIRKMCDVPRERTSVLLDGNVLVRAVPNGITTIDGYVSILYQTVRAAMQTGWLVAVVFDEPSSIPSPKREEQMRRDSTRCVLPCSVDLETDPTDDAYTVSDIYNCDDVHKLMSDRKTRMRLIDELAVRLLKKIDKCALNATDCNDTGCVVFDGIDARGANRPKDEPRFAASAVGGGAACVAEHFCGRRDAAIGEGDIKLLRWAQELKQITSHEAAAGLGLPAPPLLSLCTTIDTDALAIELMEEGRCRCHEKHVEMQTVLCIRERASKKRASDGNSSASHYLCADIAMLWERLRTLIFRNPSNDTDARRAIALMVGGWACAGCDFLKLKGMRADLVFDAIALVVRERDLSSIDAIWEEDASQASTFHAPLRHLLVYCATKLSNTPRSRQDAVTSIRSCPLEVLQRATWVCAYWNGVEHLEELDTEFGFCSAPMCSTDLSEK